MIYYWRVGFLGWILSIFQIGIIGKQMGPCMSGKQVKMAANLPAEYIVQTENQNKMIKPLFTTLFNIFRKGNEIEIIRAGQSNRKLFFKDSISNISVLNDKDLKMIFSFKNILFVGNGFEQAYKKIRTVANPKQVYIISEQEAMAFLSRFPIFGANSPIYESRIIPIYAFNSQQILKKGSKRQIFIHSASNRQDEIYSQLGITSAVQDQPQLTVQQAVQALRSITNAKSVVFLHLKQRKHEDLLNILSSYLAQEYGMAPFNAQVYIRRCLPQISLNSEIPTVKELPTSHTLRQIKNNDHLSLTQNYQRHLSQLYVEMGSNNSAGEKLSRSVNLLTTLISNIYNNKTNDSYRKVRKTNRQINDLLGKYKWGVLLLKQLGFKEVGTQFVNSTDVKYLKIYRTDLELAYKNFLSSLQNH